MTAEEKREFFEDQGYLVLEDFMRAEEVAACSIEIDRLHGFAASLKVDDPRRRNFQKAERQLVLSDSSGTRISARTSSGRFPRYSIPSSR